MALAENLQRWGDNHLPSNLYWLNKEQASIPVAEGTMRLLAKCGYLGTEGVAKLSETIQFAYHCHKYLAREERYLYRDDGTEYATHLLAVDEILAEEGCDLITLQAGILHDTLENTTISEDGLRDRFGDEVVKSVKTVTKVTGSEIDTIKKIIDALADDPRGVLIKLADRLHNMRTISYLKKETKQRSIALQTYQIFVPLARSLGMQRIADELEDDSISVLWPKEALEARIIQKSRYDSAETSRLFSPIKEAIYTAVTSRDKLSVELFQPPLHSFLKLSEKEILIVDHNYIPVEIVCRQPEDFSKIEAFLQSYGVEVADVPGEEDGVACVEFKMGERVFVISLYKWESYLKQNASLPALYRAASLWEKDDFTRQASKTEKEMATVRLDRVKMVLEQNYEEFAEQNTGPGAGKIVELFFEKIRQPLMEVRTPVGERIVLERRASAWDLAFTIHPDIGLHAQKAIINGAEKPMNTELHDGDVVKIEKGDKWNVDVGALDKIMGKRWRKREKEALKKVLKAFGKCAELKDDDPIPNENQEMGYENVGELREKAEKILNDAENRGEKILLALFEERVSGDTVISRVDLNRGWGNKKMGHKFKKRYKNDFRQFEIECGLDRVATQEMIKYIDGVAEYAKGLPKLSFIVPDRRGMLALLATVAAEKVNLVGVKIISNPGNIPPGNLQIDLTVEAGSSEILEDLRRSLERLSSELQKAIVISDEVTEVTLTYPSQNLARMLVSVLESFGVIVQSFDRDGEKITVKFKPASGKTDESLHNILEIIDGCLKQLGLS